MTSDATLTCPKCTTVCQPLTRFCEKCGTALMAGVRPRLSAGAAAVQKRSQEATAKAIRSARIALGFVAIVTLVFTFFMQGSFNSEIANARTNPQMTVNESIVSQQNMLFTVNYLLVAAYVGLMFWCSRNPFAASLTGLIIYLTIILINAALNPLTIVQGIIMKVIVVLALANGIKAGLAQRRKLADAAHAE